MLTKKAKTAADTIREEIGALIKQGETIKTAYTTKAGAFFLVFENEETGARRVWTVYER